MPTWAYECVAVAAVLGSVCALRGMAWAEIIGSSAVLLTFMHAQISDRMSERQSRMEKPDVHCHRWSMRYFVAKEALWISFFVMTGSYSAIAGSAVFMAYPLWRKFWRKRHPIV